MKQIRQFFNDSPIDSPEISIHGIGIQEIMQPMIVNRPTGTGDYFFMFFYDPLILQLDGVCREYPANSLVVWAPEHGHYYGNPDIAWKHTWMHCAGNCVQQFLDECAIPIASPIRLCTPTVMEKYLLEIYREITEQLTPNEIIAQNLLQNWMIDISRTVCPSNDARILPQRMLDARQYLEEHYNSPVSLEALAKLVNLSIPYFCSEFKRHFGISAIDYLIQLRMHQAAYLLRNQNMNITEIAHQVGYPDIFYFSKLFKKYYGISPRHMRRELQ